MVSEIEKIRAKATGKSEATIATEAFKAPKGDGLIDMKMPKAKKGDKSTECMPCDSPYGSTDKYPYGLELRFDEDSFAKLGIDLPAAGSEVTITAKATVEESSSRETQEKGVRRSCTLQITKIKVGG